MQIYQEYAKGKEKQREVIYGGMKIKSGYLEGKIMNKIKED